MELNELFVKTAEKLRATEDPEEIAGILYDFENELPEGEIRDFFLHLGENINPPAIEVQTLEELLDYLHREMEAELDKAPQQVPQEIIEAYKKLLQHLPDMMNIISSLGD